MKRIIGIYLMVVLANSAMAQKVQLKEGDVAPLFDQKSISIKFTYDNMVIGKSKTKTEESYVSEKKKELNEKEAGRGDKWSQAWVDDRENRFEPQFIELFSKHSGIAVNKENNTYTLIFKTTRTEPGWNVGVMRVAAFIDAEVWIVESANQDKIIAKITVKNSPGRDAMGFDFDTGYRIQEAYAKAGKEVAQFIEKQKKKK